MEQSKGNTENKLHMFVHTKKETNFT